MALSSVFKVFADTVSCKVGGNESFLMGFCSCAIANKQTPQHSHTNITRLQLFIYIFYILGAVKIVVLLLFQLLKFI